MFFWPRSAFLRCYLFGFPLQFLFFPFVVSVVGYFDPLDCGCHGGYEYLGEWLDAFAMSSIGGVVMMLYFLPLMLLSYLAYRYLHRRVCLLLLLPLLLASFITNPYKYYSDLEGSSEEASFLSFDLDNLLHMIPMLLCFAYVFWRHRKSVNL